MTVNFCFASGYSPTVPTYAVDEATYGEEATICGPCKLSEVGYLKYKTFSPEFMKARLKASKELPREMEGIWRERIICVLGPIKAVFCINFIPSDPHQPQTLQVMRMRDLEEEAASFPVYCHDYPSYKFILPKAHPNEVIDLSELDFSRLNPKSPIVRALKCLKQEKALKGMALTLQNSKGDLKTYVWIKPTDRKYKVLRP
jgi:hypothetical protein